MTDPGALLKLTSSVEVMRQGFVKYHLEGLPFPAVLHHITSPDICEPHDHPFGFVTHILKGGYVEEIWYPQPDYGPHIIRHRIGNAWQVPAYRIHRIVELPEGECWTLILPGPWERETRFWRLADGGIWSRQHNHKEWIRYD